MHPAIALFLAQVRTLPDTVVMLPARGSGLQTVVNAAELGILILVYVLLAAAVVAALRMRNAFDQARASLDGVGKDLREIADNAQRIARDITTVADNVRSDVTAVHETIEYANRRAKHAVGALADRVDEFNRTLAFVQGGTQSGIISAIAALRGVKAGMNAVRKRRPQRDDDGADDDAPYDEVQHDEVQHDEVQHDAGEHPADLPARPRLRRRARGKE